MLNWLKRIFGESKESKRQRFLEMVDEMNASANRGPPTIVERPLGTLKLRSGVLAFGDPQCVPSLEIPNIDADKALISARLWQYPSGGAMVAALRIELGNSSSCDPPQAVGALGIDSAALVVADKADISEHWTDTGKDRIGVISTAPDDKLLRDLQRRFKLKTVRANIVRAEIVGPVPESLEHEINTYLKSIPKYGRVSLRALLCSNEQQLRSRELFRTAVGIHARRQRRSALDVRLQHRARRRALRCALPVRRRCSTAGDD